MALSLKRETTGRFRGRAEVWVPSDSERKRNDLVEYYLTASNHSICPHLSLSTCRRVLERKLLSSLIVE